METAESRRGPQLGPGRRWTRPSHDPVRPEGLRCPTCADRGSALAVTCARLRRLPLATAVADKPPLARNPPDGSVSFTITRSRMTQKQPASGPPRGVGDRCGARIPQANGLRATICGRFPAPAAGLDVSNRRDVARLGIDKRILQMRNRSFGRPPVHMSAGGQQSSRVYGLGVRGSMAHESHIDLSPKHPLNTGDNHRRGCRCTNGDHPPKTSQRCGIGAWHRRRDRGGSRPSMLSPGGGHRINRTLQTNLDGARGHFSFLVHSDPRRVHRVSRKGHEPMIDVNFVVAVEPTTCYLLRDGSRRWASVSRRDGVVAVEPDHWKLGERPAVTQPRCQHLRGAMS